MTLGQKEWKKEIIPPNKMGQGWLYRKLFPGDIVVTIEINTKDSETRILFRAFDQNSRSEYGWGIFEIDENGDFDSEKSVYQFSNRFGDSNLKADENHELPKIIPMYSNDPEEFNGVDDEHRRMIEEAFLFLQSYLL